MLVSAGICTRSVSLPRTAAVAVGGPEVQVEVPKPHCLRKPICGLLLASFVQYNALYLNAGRLS